MSGSLEARSSSGPAATTLGATGTTSAVAGGVRRSQPRTRAAPRPEVPPGVPPDATSGPVSSSDMAKVVDSDVGSDVGSDVCTDAPPGVTSASRDAGAVPLVLPTCCAMSHSGFAARFATRLQPRKIAIRDRYGGQAVCHVFYLHTLR